MRYVQYITKKEITLHATIRKMIDEIKSAFCVAMGYFPLCFYHIKYNMNILPLDFIYIKRFNKVKIEIKSYMKPFLYTFQ